MNAATRLDIRTQRQQQPMGMPPVEPTEAMGPSTGHAVPAPSVRGLSTPATEDPSQMSGPVGSAARFDEPTIERAAADRRGTPRERNTPPPTRSILSSLEAAEYLGLRPQTLRKWRHQGRGPRYVRFGAGMHARVAYALDDLRAWIAERTFANTSEETVRNLATKREAVPPPDATSSESGLRPHVGRLTRAEVRHG